MPQSVSTDVAAYNEDCAACCEVDKPCEYDQETMNTSAQEQFANDFYYILWTFATPALFSLILLVGASGNLLVIYVILSRREMRSITNLMLVNLAVADLAFLFTIVPFQAIKYAADTWPFNDAACKALQYSLYVPAYVTIYTLVAISALRYATVVGSRATARYRTHRNAIALAIAVWICALAGNIPTLLSHRVNTFPGTSFEYCGIEEEAVWPLYLTFFVVGYALPLCAITALYALIVWHLARHAPASVDQRRARERNARTLRVVVLVVVVFGVSWLPHHVQAIISYFGLTPTGMVYEVFRIIWTCMMFGNSCANPIVYHCGSAEFRKCFTEVCRRCCCCCCSCCCKGAGGFLWGESRAGNALCEDSRGATVNFENSRAGNAKCGGKSRSGNAKICEKGRSGGDEKCGKSRDGDAKICKKSQSGGDAKCGSKSRSGDATCEKSRSGDAKSENSTSEKCRDLNYGNIKCVGAVGGNAECGDAKSGNEQKPGGAKDEKAKSTNSRCGESAAGGDSRDGGANSVHWERGVKAVEVRNVGMGGRGVGRDMGDRGVGRWGWFRGGIFWKRKSEAMGPSIELNLTQV